MRFIVEAFIGVEAEDEMDAWAAATVRIQEAIDNGHLGDQIMTVHAEPDDVEEDEDYNWHLEKPMPHDDPLPELTEEGEEVF